MKKLALFFTLFAGLACVSHGQMTGYGKLLEFNVRDRENHPREIQVFIPRNLDRDVPAKVLWFFRGTKGVQITWNIETSRIYRIALAEKAVIVAPGLFNKFWSKPGDPTDFHLVHYLVADFLSKLADEKGVPYRLDLENMAVIGFSAGGGFGYHLAGLYPKYFGAIVFRKYFSHARPLYIKVDPKGRASEDGGGQPDVQAYVQLQAAFHTLYAKVKPMFMLSVGTAKPGQKKVDRKGARAIRATATTRDALATIGYNVSTMEVPGLGHRFLVNYSKDFERQIEEFLYPLHFTSPTGATVWRAGQAAPAALKITWTALPQAGGKVDLELLAVAGGKSHVLGRNLVNSGSFLVDSSTLPARSGRYFLKISTPDRLHFNYSDSFRIESRAQARKN